MLMSGRCQLKIMSEQTSMLVIVRPYIRTHFRTCVSLQCLLVSVRVGVSYVGMSYGNASMGKPKCGQSLVEIMAFLLLTAGTGPMQRGTDQLKQYACRASPPFLVLLFLFLPFFVEIAVGAALWHPFESHIFPLNNPPHIPTVE